MNRGVEITINVRLAQRLDLPLIGQVAERAELFPASMIDEISEPAFDGGEDFWIVAEIDGTIIGFTFVEPERMTERAWNMRALAVSAAQRRKGVAQRLVEAAERHLGNQKGRLMVVDTTNLVDQEAARAFYKSVGYNEVGRIPDFFDEGTDKVTFTRHLRAA